jgi:outer membrane immunogenic protein
MMKFKQIISLLTLPTVLAGAGAEVRAADLYRTPPPPSSAYVPAAAYVDSYSWGGFYAGLNGGFAWGDGGNSILYSGGFANGDASARAQPGGGFGGGQIGYNFQSGALVYGIEADFQGGDIAGRSRGTTALGNDFTSSERADWFGTARGRLGYSFGHALIYGTGGFAYGNIRQHALVSDPATGNSALLSNNALQTGFAAGGGVEYKISPSWSLKGEYQYIDFGSAKLSGIDGGGNAVTSNAVDTNFHTVRIGLNYLFGGGREPLK